MERIFENPILLFIVIAFISSLFAKSKGNTENKRRTFPDLRKEFEETYREMTRQEEPDPGKMPPLRRSEPVYKAHVEQAVQPVKAVKEKPVSKAIAKRTQDSLRPSLSQEQKKHPEPPPSIEPVKEKNLADAIVWAEILGPPRAKKPYSKR
ncbi:hypothetical protein D1B31_08700 [Neobacillus notoginsengisoli]|uniref:Uncharacterized protein n=1 Tax=Neobacillus notoginsengisoli TaxID=1578198 RepID=A0A417YUN2_9BACI|nr:hypothetical protein [Neobacillus notoginsengisoli]RHW41017.1 hypothetical protein D1B31_08700 [Neobacillus notoginsengisoli]